MEPTFVQEITGLGQRSERRTIGYLAPAIHEASQPQWLGMVDAAQKQNVNLICFPGGSLRAPDIMMQSNVLYDLVGAENVDGIVSWASSIGNYISTEENKTFHGHYCPLPVVTIGEIWDEFPGLVMGSYEGIRQVLVHLIEVHGCRLYSWARRSPAGRGTVSGLYRSPAGLWPAIRPQPGHPTRHVGTLCGNGGYAPAARRTATAPQG